MMCAFCERPARYAVVTLGTAADIRPGWDAEQVVEGPDEIELLGMPYCSRHTGAAIQWAQSTAGAMNGCEVLHGPVEELDEVLQEAAMLLAGGDDGLSIHGPWVLTS